MAGAHKGGAGGAEAEVDLEDDTDVEEDDGSAIVLSTDDVPLRPNPPQGSTCSP